MWSQLLLLQAPGPSQAPPDGAYRLISSLANRKGSGRAAAKIWTGGVHFHQGVCSAKSDTDHQRKK
jgi:hypothetical protein